MHAFLVFYLLSMSNVLFELTNLAKRMSFKCELVGSFRVKISEKNTGKHGVLG